VRSEVLQYRNVCVEKRDRSGVEETIGIVASRWTPLLPFLHVEKVDHPQVVIDRDDAGQDADQAMVMWPVDGGLEDVELGDEAGGGGRPESEVCRWSGPTVERAAEAGHDVVERLRIVLFLASMGRRRTRRCSSGRR
jgi:hypothetical protein